LASMAKEFEAAADDAAIKSDYAAAILLYDKATLTFADACDSESADRARAKLSEATRNDLNVRAIEKNRASGRKLLHMAMGSHSQGKFSGLYPNCHFTRPTVIAPIPPPPLPSDPPPPSCPDAVHGSERSVFTCR
jgi:hypothetical protein